MAIANHTGGPADGARVHTTEHVQVRYFAPAAERSRRGWVELARYVFVPPVVTVPKVGKRSDGLQYSYRYTGIHQVQGPVAAAAEHLPEWS